MKTPLNWKTYKIANKAWKVVRRIDRSSCTVGGKYRKFYHKDAIVEAGPGTLGLMLFDTKADALSFAGASLGSSLILEVQPIGKGKRPRKICWDQEEYRMDNYYAYKRLSFFGRRNAKIHIRTAYPPEGTICYPAVKVLS